MAQITMYPAFVNSVETTITNSISDTDTIIYVLADTAIPSAPNLLVLGTGASAETVLMTDKTGNMLTVTRGVQGSAKAWPNGTVVARNYTAYDHDTFKANIEDNATQLAQKPSMTTTPITLYVSTSGNDSNNGLTPATALRNIQTAINKIPKIVNHQVEINLSVGVYDEDVLLFGFVGGGSITLKGGAVISNDYVINKLAQYNVNCTLNVIGVNAKTTTDIGFIAQQCMLSNFSFCRVPFNSTLDGILVSQGSRCVIDSCNFENRKIGIHCNNATVVSSNNTGSLNQIGLQASAGVIMKIGTQPLGATNEGMFGGGVIR